MKFGILFIREPTKLVLQQDFLIIKDRKLEEKMFSIKHGHAEAFKFLEKFGPL